MFRSTVRIVFTAALATWLTPVIITDQARKHSRGL
jgi:hypothetical protein